jgi:hypothetical protein
MGDYANDAIESELSLYMEDEEGDLILGGEDEQYEFKEIIKETLKAWCLLMSGNARHWVPKSKCSITTTRDENGFFILSIPTWLRIRKMNEALKSNQ